MMQVRTGRLVMCRASTFGFLLVALVAAGLLLAARPAHADATFTVNSTGDSGDVDLTDDVCDASSEEGNQCTLRAAIQEANNTAGPDTISFSIPDSGVQTIAPTSQLPIITGAVTIDGYTQPGASPNTLEQGNDANLLIELNGTNAGAQTSGLQIGASGSVIRGLVINRFKRDGVSIFGSGEQTGNKVEGNFIGTDPGGIQDLGNGGDGVAIFSGSDNTVGGTTPEARNVVSGNARGLIIFGDGKNKVEGNFIGTKANGTEPLGNDNEGASIVSPGNTIGGSVSGAANTIAFNAREGVLVTGDISNTGNRILGNSIFSNGFLGIDLGGEGVTPNDPDDPDTGPNDLQNFPVLTSAKTSRSSTSVKGKLNSTPNTTFTIQFFANPKGADEGKTFIGETSVTTGGEGNASFGFRPDQAVPRGQIITATATDASGNTSEFSAPRKVVRR